MEIDSALEISVESETVNESFQVSVCLKCGNEGFEETLVYCFKCEDYALHRYCLDGPVVFTDAVIWFCEDCETEVIEVDCSDDEIADSKNDEVNSSEDFDQDTADSEKVEVDSSEDFDQDTAGSEKVEVDSREDCDQDTADSEKVEVDSSEDFDQDTAGSEKVEVDSREDCDQETADSEKVEADSGCECATVADPYPIADPIWRGSLQLINKSFELMAHFSCLACLKVHEVTRHLPSVLHADLLQRSSVWPKLFKKFGANNENIGLYFFPENESVERYFDQLVDEMISNDLAIRTEVEEAELLIFSSTMLPSQQRRIQAKYYLWGVFRRKQTPS